MKNAFAYSAPARAGPANAPETVVLNNTNTLGITQQAAADWKPVAGKAHLKIFKEFIMERLI